MICLHSITLRKLLRVSPKITKVILCAIIPLAIISCSQELILEEFYADWDAAEQSGSIRRGWIPNWLPKEAINIREKHDLDSSAVAISFDHADQIFQFKKVVCEKGSDAPKPFIKMKNFPNKINELEGVQLCDGFYVYRLDKTFYFWKN